MIPKTERGLDAMSDRDFARAIRKDSIHGKKVWPPTKDSMWGVHVYLARIEYRQLLRRSRPFYCTPRSGDMAIVIQDDYNDLKVACGVPPILMMPDPEVYHNPVLAHFNKSPMSTPVFSQWDWAVARHACETLNDAHSRGRIYSEEFVRQWFKNSCAEVPGNRPAALLEPFVDWKELSKVIEPFVDWKELPKKSLTAHVQEIGRGGRAQKVTISTHEIAESKNFVRGMANLGVFPTPL